MYNIFNLNLNSFSTKLKNLGSLFVIIFSSLLTACSSSGGIYKEGDAQNGEFSVLNTALVSLAVVGVVAAAVDGSKHHKGGGGGGNVYIDTSIPIYPQWFYYNQNNTWYCINTYNNTYIPYQYCQ
jgi:hypothetical protein